MGEAGCRPPADGGHATGGVTTGVATGVGRPGRGPGGPDRPGGRHPGAGGRGRGTLDHRGGTGGAQLAGGSTPTSTGAGPAPAAGRGIADPRGRDGTLRGRVLRAVREAPCSLMSSTFPCRPIHGRRHPSMAHPAPKAPINGSYEFRKEGEGEGAPGRGRWWCGGSDAELGAHDRKEDHVADGLDLGQQHHQPVDPEADPRGRRQAVLEGAHEGLVGRVGLGVPLGPAAAIAWKRACCSSGTLSSL